MKNIIIIGGGIAGLAAAYRLQNEISSGNNTFHCSVLEGGPNFGGKIKSERFDGFIVERGPDSFITQKPWALKLCNQLGLGDDLMGTSKENTSTFVYTNHKMVPMPEGLSLLVPTRFLPFVFSPLFSWAGKIRMGMDLFIPPRMDDSDESLASFVRRRLGEEALRKMAEPMLAGIYSSDPEQMSLLSTFPMFAQTEKKYRSLTLGMLARKREMIKARKNKPTNNATPGHLSLFVTLKKGMSDLVETLIKKSPDVQFRKDTKVKDILKTSSGWSVVLEDNERIEVDAVVVATPANIASPLLQNAAPGVAQLLGRIPYVSTAAVTLAFRKQGFSHPLKGYGFVVPRNEGHHITACTWTSSKYSGRVPEDHVLLRCYVGGGSQSEMAHKDEAELEKIVRDDLRRIMGITEEPAFCRVYYNRQGNVQYQVGHGEIIDALDTELKTVPGLFLTGSAYRGVGIPDCALHGEQTAQAIINYLSNNHS